MSDVRGCRSCSLGDLDRMVASGGQVVLLSAPDIGSSESLQKLAEEGQVRLATPDTLEDPRPATAEQPIPTVIDSFFEIVMLYLEADSEEQETILTAIKELQESGRIFIRTSPYRFEWLLDKYLEEVGVLLGNLEEWTVKTIEVDLEDAREQIARTLPEGSEVTEEHLRETKWPDNPYDLEASLAVAFDSEKVENILAVREYQSLVPGMIEGSGDVTSVLEQRSSVADAVRAMLGDLSAAGSIEGTTGQDEGVLQAIRDLGSSVVNEGVEPLIDRLGLEPGVIVGAAGGLGLTVAGPGLAAGAVVFWAYLSHRKGGKVRETIREEFQLLFETGRPTITAAQREEIERERNLPPTSLETFDQTTRGLSGDFTELVDELGETLEVVESVLRDHDETLERIATSVRESRPTYMPLEDFEEELYELPDYISPQHDEDLTVPGHVLNHLAEERSSVTILTGESGIGKSRLMLEVGRRLPDDVDVWYVRDPPSEHPPPAGDRVVLFLDEAGRTDHATSFFDQTLEHRRNWDCDILQVVAAVRPIYEKDISAEIPDSVPMLKVNIPSLSIEGTTHLLSDVGIDKNTAVEIHSATDGNPFLARLLALAEEPHDASTGPEEKIHRVIRERFLEEPADANADPEGVEELLKILAIANFYDPENIEPAIGDIRGVDLPTNRRRILRDLAETNYVDQEFGDTFDTPTYTHRVDIFAEYLRWMVLTEAPSTYADLVDRLVHTTPDGLTRGLVELRESTLARFDFFANSTVSDRTRELITEQVSDQITHSDASGVKILRAASMIAREFPDAFDHEEILKWYQSMDFSHDAAEDVSSQLTRFTYTSFKQGPETGLDFSIGSRWLSNHASLADEYPENDDIQLDFAATIVNALHVGKTEWLGHLESLAEQYEDDKEMQLRFAIGLINAIRAGETEHLQRLESLAKEYPEQREVQAQYAAGLTNAIGEGETEHVERLRSFAEERCDQSKIRVQLVKGLVNAIAHGETEQLQHLESFAEKYPSQDKIQEYLAKGLSYAISHGSTESVERLEALAKENPNYDEIQDDRALGLVHAIGNGRMDCLDRLESLASEYSSHEDIQLRFANGLVTAIAVGNTDCLDSLESLAEEHPDDGELHYELATGYHNAIIQGETEHLNRLEEVAERWSSHREIQMRFANGLVNTIIDGEIDRTERLATLAAEHPDHETILGELINGFKHAVQRGDITPLNTLGPVVGENPRHDDLISAVLFIHLVALDQVIQTGDIEAIDSMMENLENVADRACPIKLAGQSSQIQNYIITISKKLGQEHPDQFERFAAAVGELIEPSRWKSIEARILVAFDKMVSDNRISAQELTSVIATLDERNRS